jgi:O-antigen ligase
VTARAPARLTTLAVLALLAAVAAAAGTVIARQPAPGAAPLLVIGAAGAFALAAARLDLAIGIGFLVLGVVKVEPAPSDALLSVVIAVCALGGALDLRRVPGPMLMLLTLLLAINVLSMLDAVALGAAARFLSITLYMVVLAVWLASWATTPARVRLVVRAYVIGAALVTAPTLLAVLGFPVPGHASLIGEGVRAQGLFKDPNVFGPYLIPPALILLEETVRPRILGFSRGVCVLLLVEMVLGIVFAYSRAGWLNFAIAVVVLLGIHVARGGGGRRLAALLAIVLALGGTALAVVAVSGADAVLRERARTQRYDTQRFGAQRTGIKLAEDHPLGVGPGQFDVLEPISTHSIYVRLLAEQGLAGLLTLVAVLAGTLALAVGNVVAGRDAYGVGSAVLLAAWCGLLANSAFIDTLHWRHLWVVAALIWMAARRRLA